MMIKEIDLIEKKDTRNQFLDRIDLLESVKEILTLPNTELLTTKMVADYFEVGQDVIRKVIERNNEELTSNGMVFKKYGEVKELLGSDGLYLGSDTLSHLGINKRGVNIFSKRALLNIGMLLQNSVRAKELRNQILNTLDKVSDEVKTQSITEEEEMILKIFRCKSDIERLTAISEYDNYRNRQLAETNARLKEKESIIEEQRPHVEFSKEVIYADGTLPVMMIAKEYGVSAQALNKILNQEDIIYKKGSQWYLYAQYQDKGYMKSYTTVENGIAHTHNRWTQKGRKFIHEKMKELGFLTVSEREKIQEEG